MFLIAMFLIKNVNRSIPSLLISTACLQALSIAKSKQLLASLGYHYNTSSIVKSELRLLKTLEFRVAVSTPLTFIETLLEVLGKFNNFSFSNFLATIHFMEFNTLSNFR